MHAVQEKMQLHQDKVYLQPNLKESSFNSLRANYRLFIKSSWTKNTGE